MPTATPAACQQPDCSAVRTDEPDYSAVQPIMGLPLGWYSGEKDGELCPRHIAELMAFSNRRRYEYHVAGGGVEATK